MRPIFLFLLALLLSIAGRAQIVIQQGLLCYGDSTSQLMADPTTCGTAPFTYAWSTGDNTQIISGQPSGNYSVTVTDNSLPVNVTVFSLTLNDPPLLQGYVAVSDISCGGGNDGSAIAIFTGGTGAYTYSWSDGSSDPGDYFLTTGGYAVTVTDINGCSATDSAFVSEPPPIVIAIDTVIALTCPGYQNGAIQLTINGGVGALSISWLYNNAFFPEISEDLNNIAAGLYQVTATDATGCNVSSLINVTEPTPTFYDDSVRQISCNNGADGYWSIEPIGPNNPYIAIFSTGDTISTDTVPAPAVSGLFPGGYTCVITGSDSCQMVFTLVLQQAIQVTVGLSSVVDVNCKGAATGSITLASIQGGNNPYTFAWNNGMTTNPIVNLIAGNYTVTITDSVGCMAINTYEVEEPYEYIKIFPDVTPTSCASTIDGKIVLEEKNVFWSPFNNLFYVYDSNGVVLDTLNLGEELTGLAPGTYIGLLVNQFGCLAADTMELEEGPPNCDLFVIPNFISPNGDGLNDVFAIEDACGFDEFQVIIFDDMGKQVFESTDCLFSWSPLEKYPSNSVFYYYIKVTDAGSVWEYKNSINVNY